MDFFNNSNGINITTVDPKSERPFRYYSLFVVLFLLVPISLLDIFIIVATYKADSIPKTIKLVLINLFSGSVILALGLIIIFLADVILSGCRCGEPSDFVCRLAIWSITAGGASRLEFVALFSSLVFAIVKNREENVKLSVFIVLSIIFWLISLILNAPVFIPEVWQLTFVGGVTCYPQPTGINTFIHVAFYFTIFCMCGFTVTIVMPIVTICYIKHNTITGDTALYKAMAKFALFLLIGNGANFTGLSTPVFLALFAVQGKENVETERIFSYMEGIFLNLSLIPAPILVLVYFKPVRIKILQMITGTFGRKIKAKGK